MNKNIVLDFTANRAVESTLSEQELAIMPATLAKKLLKDYATKLVSASAYGIIVDLINDLRSIKDTKLEGDKIKMAMETCADFIQERTLIDACSKENWELFSVKPEVVIQEVVIQEDPIAIIINNLNNL